MSTDPVTPREPPPFQACPLKGPPTPVIHPRDDRLGLFLPLGNKLILHGVYCQRTAIGDPVPIVKKLLKQLHKTNPILKDIPVVVKPYSIYHKSTSSTTCYLHLHLIFNPITTESTDAEPRCNLLSDWMVAIEATQPKWEFDSPLRRLDETKDYRFNFQNWLQRVLVKLYWLKLLP